MKLENICCKQSQCMPIIKLNKQVTATEKKMLAVAAGAAPDENVNKNLHFALANTILMKSICILFVHLRSLVFTAPQLANQTESTRLNLLYFFSYSLCAVLCFCLPLTTSSKPCAFRYRTHRWVWLG